MSEKTEKAEKKPTDTNDEIKLPAGVTVGHVENWKKKHGIIKLIEVANDEGVILSGVFKQPDMDILSAVAKRGKTDEVGGAELLYKSCKLAVDEEIEQDMSLKMSVIKQLKFLVTARTASIKKL